MTGVSNVFKKSNILTIKVGFVESFFFFNYFSKCRLTLMPLNLMPLNPIISCPDLENRWLALKVFFKLPSYCLLQNKQYQFLQFFCEDHNFEIFWCLVFINFLSIFFEVEYPE